jgi:hypothetical protein
VHRHLPGLLRRRQSKGHSLQLQVGLDKLHRREEALLGRVCGRRIGEERLLSVGSTLRGQQQEGLALELNEGTGNLRIIHRSRGVSRVFAFEDLFRIISWPFLDAFYRASPPVYRSH